MQTSCSTSAAARFHEPGARLQLTATEYSLLRYFLLHPRRVVSKPQLLRDVWQYQQGGSVNLVETYVSYLRRKLEREDRG